MSLVRRFHCTVYIVPYILTTAVAVHTDALQYRFFRHTAFPQIKSYVHVGYDIIMMVVIPCGGFLALKYDYVIIDYVSALY